jgi:hypothetical protein
MSSPAAATARRSREAVPRQLTGLPLNELYEKVDDDAVRQSEDRTTEQLDILAFMLSKNQFPAGTKVLTTDSTLLKDIKLLQDKPSSP